MVHLRMAGHMPVNAAEHLQILHREETPQRQGGVEPRRTVPLGEHEAVPVRVGRIGRVHMHHVSIQEREDIHGGQGAADVAGGGGVHHIHRQQAGVGRSDGQRLLFRLFHPIHLSIPPLPPQARGSRPYDSPFSIAQQSGGCNRPTAKNRGLGPCFCGYFTFSGCIHRLER